MHRSFSTSFLLGLLGVAAMPAQAAESLEASLAAEIEVARTHQIYLVLDTQSSEVQVKAHGLVLDAIDFDSLSLDHRKREAERHVDRRLEIPPILVIERGAIQRREIVIGGENVGVGGSSEDERLASFISPVQVGFFACQLEGGWILEVGDGQRPEKLWQRVEGTLANSFASWAEGSPTLILRLSSDNAERLRHLFRRDVAVLIR